MNCQEVEKWLTQKPDSPNTELTDHIAECEACASMAEATRVLKNGLLTVAEVGESPALAEFRTRVSERAAQINRWSRLMTSTRNIVQNNRRFVIPAAAVVAVCLFISLVPLPHSVVIGYEIEMTGLSAEQAANPEVLQTAFAKAGYDDVKVARKTDNAQTVYRLENVRRPTDAYAMAAVATLFSGSSAAPKITAIAAQGKATLLAQATSEDKEKEDNPVRIRLKDGKFYIDIDSIGGDVWTLTESTSELKNRIAEILKRIGIENAVGVSATADDSDTTQYVMLIVRSDGVSESLGVSDSLLESWSIKVDDYGRKIVGSLATDGLPDTTKPILFIDYVEGDDDNKAMIIIKAPIKK